MLRESRVLSRVLRPALILTLGSLVASSVDGQRRPPNPRRSQPAVVSQTLGETRLTITYNRPVARGRTLFGGIVRWGEVWCPGADEATTLETTGDVTIATKRLPAGKYTVWAIPGEQEWTMIFSDAVGVWHVPYPGPDRDRLRVNVSPQRGSPVESLAFYFPMSDLRAATLRLHWGETFVDLPIEVP